MKNIISFILLSNLIFSCGKYSNKNEDDFVREYQEKTDKEYHKVDEQFNVRKDLHSGFAIINLKLLDNFNPCDAYGEKGKKLLLEAGDLERNILARAKALDGGFHYEIEKIAFGLKRDLEQSLSEIYHRFCEKN